MSDHVYKTIEITGSSAESLEDAMRGAVVKASETGALGAGTSSPEVRANVPPVVKVDGSKTLTAKVGQPLCYKVNFIFCSIKIEIVKWGFVGYPTDEMNKPFLFNDRWT